MSSLAPASERFHQLDGMRAVAIGLVVIHHFFTPAMSAALASRGLVRGADALGLFTNSGVELFFVLSGVVLLRAYFAATRPFVIGTYFTRRVERLWPPYVVALLLAGGVAAVVRDGERMRATGVHLAPPAELWSWIAQLFIVNPTTRTFNFSWWSLSLEVLFYILAPLVILGLSLTRRRREWTLAAAALCAVLSGIFWRADYSMPGFHGVLTPQQFLAYSPCFAVGVVLAVRVPPRRMLLLAGAFGLVAFLCSVEWPHLNVHTAFAFLYASAMGLALVKASHLARLLSGHWMVWIGERSYSIFLVHVPALYLSTWLVATRLDPHSAIYFVASRLMAVVLTTLFTIAIFGMVERRFARRLVTAHALFPWNLSHDDLRDGVSAVDFASREPAPLPPLDRP